MGAIISEEVVRVLDCGSGLQVDPDSEQAPNNCISGIIKGFGTKP